MNRSVSAAAQARHARIRARRKKIFLWFAVVGLLIVIAAGTRPLFHWFKVKRATQIAAAADNFARLEKWKEAADKYRAALQLDPINYAALKGAANLATRLGRPEAIDLWEQVAKTHNATVPDRQQYAEQLLIADRPRLAALVIDPLLKQAPDTTTLQLASRYAQKVGDTNKAVEFARLAVKRAPDDQAAQFRLAQLLAESTNEEQRAEARKILWRLTDQPGSLHRSAIEALARAPELTDSERERVLQMLGAIGPSNVRDDLLAADLRLQLQPDQAVEIYDQLMARWNQSGPSDLLDLARWLNVHQQAERVLSLFPVDAALRNNQLLLARLDALATLQRWNEIDAVLGRPDLNIDPSVLESFRARTAQEQNAPLDADLHWNHAITLAAGDPLKLRFIANFAEQSRAPAIALKAYDQLAKFPEYAGVAYYATERLSGRNGDLSVQKSAAQKIAALSPQDVNARAQVAYLNLLAGNEVEANATAAKDLARRYPNRLSFRVAAALGYLREHDPGQALAQFQGPPGAPPIDWQKTPMNWRAVYAATLRANEHNDAADQIIKTIATDHLNAEERALIQAQP